MFLLFFNLWYALNQAGIPMLLLQRYGIAMRAVLMFLPDILFVGWPCKSEPPAPSHGTVNCSFGSYQGSECHFICDAGYALSPNSQYPVMCMRNRQYNGSTPACQRKYSPVRAPALLNHIALQELPANQKWRHLATEVWRARTVRI